jgi:hypothetical protein
MPSLERVFIVYRDEGSLTDPHGRRSSSMIGVSRSNHHPHPRPPAPYPPAPSPSRPLTLPLAPPPALAIL